MKYERPRLMMLGTEQGAGYCADGSGATSLGAEARECRTGTIVSPTLGCLNGAGDTSKYYQCSTGGDVSIEPACQSGADGGL